MERHKREYSSVPQGGYSIVMAPLQRKLAPELPFLSPWTEAALVDAPLQQTQEGRTECMGLLGTSGPGYAGP